MKNDLVRVNSTALALFDRTLELAQKMEEEAEFRPADWFDSPEKRRTWWHDLEPQWQRAFQQACFFRKGKETQKSPADEELEHLFSMREIDACGAGVFARRNNPPDLNFQLTNVTGLRNLTNLRRIEVDYNGLIESLEPLSMLTNLTVLWCDNNRINDLSPLAGLPNLSNLCCWNNQIDSLEPLRGNCSLRELTLGLHREGNPIQSWEPLVECRGLRRVYYGGCPTADLEQVQKKLVGKGIYWSDGFFDF